MIFQRKYFLWTILLFTVEICIALFVHDRIVRPYVGDLLVVILLYCFVKSFIKISVWKAAIGVLIFAYLIEVLQALKLIYWLGLQHSKIARTIIGISFQWLDLLAYTVGIAIVVTLEFNRKSQTPIKP